MFFPTSSSWFRSLYIGNFPSFWNRLILPLPCSACDERQWSVSYHRVGRVVLEEKSPISFAGKVVRDVHQKLFHQDQHTSQCPNDIFSEYKNEKRLLLSFASSLPWIWDSSLEFFFCSYFSMTKALSRPSKQHVWVAWSYTEWRPHLEQSFCGKRKPTGVAWIYHTRGSQVARSMLSVIFFFFPLLKFYLEPPGAATGTLQKFSSQWKE